MNTCTKTLLYDGGHDVYYQRTHWVKVEVKVKVEIDGDGRHIRRLFENTKFVVFNEKIVTGGETPPLP